MNRKKFEDFINEEGRLIYRAVGSSMFPLIKERDLLVIEKIKEPLKKGDVPLYKRDSGQYVLHRIIDIKNGKYLIKGDNREQIEKGITDRHIIGVLTSIIRDGNTFPVEASEDYVTRNAKDLIYLVSCAVNGEIPDKERTEKLDIQEIYRQSRNHMLTSAVSYALEQIMPLPHEYDQSRKKAIRKLSLFDIERSAVLNRLNQEKIWHLPLKGIILKDSYPKASMREMSDNDILVDSSRMNDIKDIMEELGYKTEMFDTYNHDVYSKPPTVEFEMHRSLFPEDSMPLFSSYYKDLTKRLIRNGYEYRMTDEDFYIYLLCHTYKHYIHAGTGLRSLLDFYVYTGKHPDMDREYLNSELKKLGLTDYEKETVELSQKTFGCKPLNEKERKKLEYYINSGNYGNINNMEYHSMSKNLNGDDSKKSKRRYLMSRIFISGESLEKNYPFIAKHKVLYPLLIIYRPIKGALIHPKTIIKEYSSVKKFKKREL